MAAQIAPREARALANYVIENNGDMNALRERTRPYTSNYAYCESLRTGSSISTDAPPLLRL